MQAFSSIYWSIQELSMNNRYKLYKHLLIIINNYDTSYMETKLKVI